MVLVTAFGRTVLYYRFLKVDVESLVAEYWENAICSWPFFLESCGEFLPL